MLATLANWSRTTLHRSHTTTLFSRGFATRMTNQKNIVLVGGGNAIHVMTGYLSVKPEYSVSVFTSLEGEADKFRAGLEKSNGMTVKNDLGPDVVGKPKTATKEITEVIPSADIIVFALPSFAHEAYLKSMAPHIREGTIIGAMPAQGGFDSCVVDALGQEKADKCSIFGLETLPWACRLTDYGSRVEVLGTKKDVDVTVTPAPGTTGEEVVEIVQTLMGQSLPRLHLVPNFLAVTLMNINSVWHPVITMGRFKDWDRKTPYPEPPLFYEGVDQWTADMLCKVSDEVQQVKAKINSIHSEIDLTAARHVRDWMVRTYDEDIGDKTDLGTCIRTNKGYKGLVHPMVEVDGGFVPNWKYRYTAEDVPCGLLVTRGIAELAGVPTPNMDSVLEWAQGNMGKEYLVDGKLTGKDIPTTRIPQRYGFKDLETYLKAHRYTK